MMETNLDNTPEGKRPALPEIGPTGIKIVDGARTCFERFGIEKTTIEDIAKAAGVSRPTVYKFFTGKMEIVDYIGFGELEKIQDELRTRVKRHTNFAEMVTEAVLSSVKVAAENPYVRRFVEDLEVTAHSQLPSSPYQLQAQHRWESVLRRARDNGELAKDLKVEEVVEWLSRNQVMLLRTIDQVAANEDHIRHMVRRFVVEPLLADRGSPPKE